MPHTISRALGETALIAYCQDHHWREIGLQLGCPASRLRDSAGREVYASVYFVELEASSELGLASFQPDDVLDVEQTLGRYGASMLDGRHRLSLPVDASGRGESARIDVRMSFVLAALGRGPDDLSVSTPSNGRMDAIPSLPAEPDSYRLIRRAKAAGGFEGAVELPRLWEGMFSGSYPINPDRDLNGVGLLYFANYVAFLDLAEREAFAVKTQLAASELESRVTHSRKIAYYGNARASDQLCIDVEAFELASDPTPRWLVQHRIRRASDDRLIALATAERVLRRIESGPSVD